MADESLSFQQLTPEPIEPLDFNDCIPDSPEFRYRIRKHEAILNNAGNKIKTIIKEATALRELTAKLETACEKFGKALSEFQLASEGSKLTDNEKAIAKALQGFYDSYQQTEAQRTHLVLSGYSSLVENLDKLRQTNIKGTKTYQKKFEKHSEKYYTSVEKLIQSSSKKKDLTAEYKALKSDYEHFLPSSMEYVLKLQEAQERTKIEYVEQILVFMRVYVSSYYTGYMYNEKNVTLLKQFESDIAPVRLSIERSFEQGRSIKDDFLSKPFTNFKPGTPEYKDGYLWVGEKKSSLQKYFCVFYQKSPDVKKFDMTPYSQTHLHSELKATESYTFIHCVRRNDAEYSRPNCFDVKVSSDKGESVIVLQALSPEERKAWIDAMEGEEPKPLTIYGEVAVSGYELDEKGLNFVTKAIEAIEAKGGLNFEGIYRVAGSITKMKSLMDAYFKDGDDFNAFNFMEPEYDIRTVSSCLKNYLMHLREPVIPYKMCQMFLDVHKIEDKEKRPEVLHQLVYDLPQTHFDVLKQVICHLNEVAANCNTNRMSSSNLGVIFGPSLIRQEVQCLTEVITWKINDTVLQLLIDHYHQMFETKPSTNHTIHKTDKRIPPNIGSSLSYKGVGVSPVSTESLSSSSSGHFTSDSKPKNLYASLPRSHSSSPSILSPPPKNFRVRALYDCNADHDSELTFRADDIITNVHMTVEPGWLEGVFDGKTGLLPANYVLFMR